MDVCSISISVNLPYHMTAGYHYCEIVPVDRRFLHIFGREVVTKKHTFTAGFVRLSVLTERISHTDFPLGTYVYSLMISFELWRRNFHDNSVTGTYVSNATIVYCWLSAVFLCFCCHLGNNLRNSLVCVYECSYVVSNIWFITWGNRSDLLRVHIDWTNNFSYLSARARVFNMSNWSMLSSPRSSLCIWLDFDQKLDVHVL